MSANETRHCAWLFGMRLVKPPTWCSHLPREDCESTALSLGDSRFNPCMLAARGGRCVSAWPGGIRCASTPGSFSCSTCAKLPDQLVREARHAVERRQCTWGALDVELWLLAEPRGSPDRVFFGPGDQTRSWLRSATRHGGLHCAAATPQRPMGQHNASGRPALSLVAADFRFFHTHTEPSAVGAHGIGAHLVPEVRRALCAHYHVLASLLLSTRGVALINFGGEWVEPDYLLTLEQLLGSCGISPARAVLLHYNVGTMLPLEANFLLPTRAGYLKEHWSPFMRWARAAYGSKLTLESPRLRQAYWNYYYAAILKTTRTCTPAHELRARYEEGVMRRRNTFTMLGGQAKAFRGVVVLELARRNLLDHAQWSAGRFPFCSEANASAARHSKGYATAGPFAYNDSLRLLSDNSLVGWLCAQLPHTLDVDPTQKSLTDFGAAQELYRTTHFAVVLETSIDSAVHNRVLYVTEKPLKPMLNLRPFVLLGSAGSLATLRSLGFYTFEPLMNEQYDELVEREPRLSLALGEVERLATRLPLNAWKAASAAAAHNQRHLACGGLRKVMGAHATEAVRLAWDISRLNRVAHVCNLHHCKRK